MAIAKALSEFKKRINKRTIDGKSYYLQHSAGMTKSIAMGNADLMRKQRPHMSFRVLNVGTGNYYSKGHEYAIFARRK